MAQQVKELVSKPDDPSLTSSTHTGLTCRPLSSTCALWHMHTHTINVKKKKLSGQSLVLLARVLNVSRRVRRRWQGWEQSLQDGCSSAASQSQLWTGEPDQRPAV